MKNTLILLTVCFASILLSAKTNPEKLKQAELFLKKQELSFEQNKGQISGADAGAVTYFVKSGSMTFFLLKNGISYQFTKKNNDLGQNKFKSPEELLKTQGKIEKITTETYRMDMILQGANPNPKISAEEPFDAAINYENKNIGKVGRFSKITYHDIYPNIDWVVYISNQNIEYDFVVRPNGNPDLIKFKSKWAEKTELGKDGSVSLYCKLGKVTQLAPFSFQNDKNISSKAILKDDILSFKISKYDRKQTLTIDPIIGWATYFGGTDFDAGTACTVDAANNIYLTGYTNSAANIASGGYQNTFAGGAYDAFLAKFSSSGTLLWATYYGGNSEDKGNSVAIDAAGNVYMAGTTYSASNIASSGAQQSANAGLTDAFLVKFDSDGNRIWATYFGGEYYDEGYSCAVDNSGNVFMAGFAWSSTGITTTGSHQPTSGGGTDGFLVKYDSNGARQWSTYYGGNQWETGYCTTDINGNVYLAGFTSSTNNIASSGAHQTVLGWGDDAYLVKFDTNGVRQWGTYYGGSNYDWAYFPDTDSQGNVYITGHTGSPDAIATTDAYQTSVAGSYDAFLAKFDSNGVRQWGTYYGGTDEERASACAVDSSNNVILTGYTHSSTGISTTGAFHETYGGIKDAFGAKFDSSGNLMWGTYIGGTDEDFGAFCAVDASGNVYFTGYTSSGANISTAGSFQENFAGTRDAYLVNLNSNGNLNTAEFSAGNLKIYPNPTKDFVEISSKEKIKTLVLFDVSGKQMMSKSNPENKISLERYPKGMYLLKITFENGKTETRKILKK